jgi:ketosteroid isomerase-like protein
MVLAGRLLRLWLEAGVGDIMREQVIKVVEQYIDAVRHNNASALPLHQDAVCVFPTSTYRGAASFQKGLDDFARVMKSIEVIRSSSTASTASPS